MGRADLHIHTTFSDGTGSVTAVLEAASRAGLDVIAITDHDGIRGALLARDLGPRYGIAVVPGVEITTADGHLLALYVEHGVPAGRSLRETALRVRDLGGICVAPHPSARWVSSLGARCIEQALDDAEVAEVLLGVEVYNGGLPWLWDNLPAEKIASRLRLSPVASTDSHLTWTVGLCASEFPGRSPAELRHALETRQIRPHIGRRPWLGFYTSFVKNQALSRLGLVSWAAHPGGAITLRRRASVGA